YSPRVSLTTALPLLFSPHPAPTALSTLSLHDALPIWRAPACDVLQERRRPAALRRLPHGRADVPLLQGHAAVPVRIWLELHHLRLQEPARQRRHAPGR